MKNHYPRYLAINAACRVAMLERMSIASAILLAAGGNTFAQEVSQSGSSALDEVIVSAQKREERLIDVPISIVALSSDELQKRKISNVDDLGLVVPGLAIASNGAQQRRIALRGISNISGNSSLIGMYIDEAAVSAGSAGQLDVRAYDLERVEVLRGPQGTLYGDGSLGGTIRFITKNPALNRFSVNANIAALVTEGGAPGQRIDAALNVPIIENEFGLRIAGTFDHEGGWIDQPAANKKDFNDQNLADVRVKGLWKPTAQFTADAMALIHRNNGPLSQGEEEKGIYTQTFNLTATPSVDDDYDLYNLTLTYDLGPARVLNTTSYLDSEKLTRNRGNRYQFDPPGNPRYDVFERSGFTNSTIVNDELRLTSSDSSPLAWTIGSFYRHARFEGIDDLIYFDLPIPAGAPLPAPFCTTPCESRSLSKSWAAFGDTNYKFTNRVSVGMGLRYFEDNQSQRTAPFLTGKFHALNPRFYGQYKLSENAATYASIAKGFRSGGFNDVNQPTYKPESVLTYELGTKIFFADSRLNFDAAVFYSDYTDYQIVGTAILSGQPFTITSNAGNAKLKGIEWGLQWHPTESWSLGLNGDFLDSEFYKINTSSSSHNIGDPLDLSPKYTFTISTDHEFNWHGVPGFVHLDYSQHGPSTFRFRTFGPWYYSESDVINLMNFNLGFRWSDSLSMSVFGQNMLNDRGYPDPIVIEANSSRVRPRTYGVQFTVNFE